MNKKHLQTLKNDYRYFRNTNKYTKSKPNICQKQSFSSSHNSIKTS